MKFAIISDIHSNFPALQAVRDALPDVSGVICCGDVTGYYCYPNEVCNALREMKARTIRGNHDVCNAGLADPGENGESYRTEWTRRNLNDINLKWLRGLPAEIIIKADGLTLRIRHASPWDETTYLYHDSERTDAVVLDENEWLLCGHTHRPMFRQTSGGGFIANPGSVGQPRDRDPRASWALLDTALRRFEIQRTRYPVSELQQTLTSLDWPLAVTNILSRTL